ncbi:hypothetical protein [Mycobacteroides abscessus]|uniref:hypothetical protein n=1 Tax=unclassified Desemzia TaxID=2685243 RepID=UPI0009CAA3CB|nr:Uncharacterised protein [Mycobacteroides abscessus subsp. abscessus]
MFEYIVMFLVGYAIGKSPFIIQWLKVREENKELKKDIIVLKEHLTNSGRGRIIHKSVQDE